MPPIPLLLLGIACAGLMGYAIQRGATCMVAAMDELVSKRKATRLIALVEAAAIVAGGLALARLDGHLAMEPVTYAITASTVAGGVLLGLGAFWAGACVFGAIARLGSGQWAYALVPTGFFLGCLIAGPVLRAAPAMASNGMSPVFVAASWLTVPLGLLLLWRAAKAYGHARSGQLASYVWSPHVATAVIGLTFVILLLAVGPWSYTEYLASAARGMSSGASWKGLLFVALLGGAIVGGWTAGRLKAIVPTPADLARCLGGGALMGAGSVLIPGSNDGLILIGTPLLHLYAWVALGVMALTIVVAMLIQRRAKSVAGVKQKA
ncbi:YeeE/YedE thiosulfate transporter family protein [Sphingomonas jaspsi]|uniref:YeeE/YedE thiosulfate transporter family protein n=1 Tax=Sphingomonas jaspsi TaxID=392409 RepID=UPI0005642510|nr:YeeE/YedE thiosulfate transporter family protein [Sphingomonas jaspsi]